KSARVKSRSSGASPKTALCASRSTASMRPAASESAGDLVRQQDVAPRRARRGAPSSERSAGPSRAGGRRTTKGVTMQYFVGLDWAAREHAVCVLDERGAVTMRFTVAHTDAGMTELVTRLAQFGAPAELRVAIERPSGLVVDTLVEGDFAVVPIHPNAVKAARPRYSAAQGKTDLGDAYLLGDLLRTDGHRFRTLSPLSDETKALRGLVRTRDDLVERRVALANQLRSLLGEFWAGAAEIFADVDSPIALDFLDRYPTPQSAASLGEKRLAAFLARHAYCGRRSAADLLARLRSAPRSVAGELEADAKGDCVRALVAVLR